MKEKLVFLPVLFFHSIHRPYVQISDKKKEEKLNLVRNFFFIVNNFFFLFNQFLFCSHFFRFISAHISCSIILAINDA